MMDSAIETTDHDEGVPPLYGAPLGALVPVLIDGRRWIVLPPGDPIAAHLVEPGAGRHGQA